MLTSAKFAATAKPSELAKSLGQAADNGSEDAP
jgi:hypothetical protein